VPTYKVTLVTVGVALILDLGRARRATKHGHGYNAGQDVGWDLGNDLDSDESALTVAS
jgi:hypothetical protein